MKSFGKTLFCAAAALLFTQAATAQSLSFKKGEFKVMQLTDLHLSARHPDECRKVYDRIVSLNAIEEPDFIVITGDMVFAKPAEPAIKGLVEVLDACGAPWGVVFGNHDAEQDLSRAEMSRLYTEGRNNVNTLNDKGELADIELPVTDGGRPAYYMLLLDSHDYNHIDRKDGAYAWFTKEQVEQVRGWGTGHDGGSAVPSLAFFHIPLAEFIDAWTPMENTHLDKGFQPKAYGIRGEPIACGALNSGMFAAMKEAGSVSGVFCGHDHDNDFIALWRGITLAYGRFSGCNSVYNNLPCGARIITVTPRSRTIESWIRDDNGRITQRTRSTGTTIKRAKNIHKGCLYGEKTPL